ncbi:ATP-binding protein [Nocardioides zeae]|uniref:ATP-binding protein n=1 Tax=Nocardioides imazamoxiresistens TaxID=3231893 RepID=A0ABU3Q1J2_9ACTN|nr:ATP-binding protein [Nocardioides zeae]MDT9595373.1 ATP-binding protein [Nocardioides zeae]
MQQARRWAASVCRELDREDLVDACELGVSELVTNALLHAEPPIALAVRGTRAHPRIEVFDGSRTPPVLTMPDAPEPDEDDELGFLMTVGRGLGLVAMNSSSWGADITAEGKVVWFEPVPEPRLDGDLEGQVFDVTMTTGEIERVPTFQVRLHHMPLAQYRDFRRHYSDLRREVRLLSLAHEDHYPLARDLSRRFDLFDEHVDNASLVDTVASQLAAGRQFGDHQVTVGKPAADLSHQMQDLLDLADAFCRSQRLLSLARSDEQREFQRWLLGEISSQASGSTAAPWREPGGDSNGAHAS